MDKHKIKTSKTATYHTIGNPVTATKIIFALHGYGQLTEFFIRRFKGLDQSFFIVTPEGLNRFYLNGSSGRVGASWMTKEKRDDDINDYINYLDEIWNSIRTKHTFTKRVLLGFSQGGATASRWHNRGEFSADQFLLWAGVFPTDLKQVWLNAFNNSDNKFIVGNKDEYFSEEKIKDQEQYFKQNSVNFTTVYYNGFHSIDNKTLVELLK